MSSSLPLDGTSVADDYMEASLPNRYQTTRQHSQRIAAPLEVEDTIPQSMPDASPIRWHLAHTTWFFETFILKKWDAYEPLDDRFETIFNSYYNGVGEPLPRDQRGLSTRPTLAEVMHYRQHVDAAMLQYMDLLREGTIATTREVLATIEIGLHHEQQHQELMLTDVKHLLSLSPLHPIYQQTVSAASNPADSSSWLAFEGGVFEIGAESESDFCFDNELPRHSVHVNPFELRRDLVRAGEFIEFMEAGGYYCPEHWLSMGWAWTQSDQASSPLYWRSIDGVWHHYTLGGLLPVDRNSILTHVNYFEADAFARWSGHRLPTEVEWEVAASGRPIIGSFSDLLMSRSYTIHPVVLATDEPALKDLWPDLFGTVWQWTSSQYGAYPGYRPPDGTLGEYNGKFMCNQFVLRGGSCATSSHHVRHTYRNFFPPQAQWQFTGIRLAQRKSLTDH